MFCIDYFTLELLAKWDPYPFCRTKCGPENFIRLFVPPLGGGMEINMQPTEKQLKMGRFLYIWEATFEYLISILVAGSFLATLTKELGFSDGLCGILSAFVSLGCVFQLGALMLRAKSVKRIAVILGILNEALFIMLYVVPITSMSKPVKSALFITFMVMAYIIMNFIAPHKLSWLMSLVEDKKRGVFTATKESVSLLTQMGFSYVMGMVMDDYLAAGNTKAAFTVAAAVMFALMLLHTLTVVFTVEKERPAQKKISLLDGIKAIVRNKKAMQVTVVCIFYYVSNYSSLPFYGRYMINELGFTLKFTAVLTIFAGLSRICVARLWGRYADKSSFAAMIEKCFCVLVLSYLCVVFSTPANGAVMFICYNVMHGIAMGGINSALTNLVFDYVPEESRATSLAVNRAIAGTIGFVTTLCFSPIVDLIQGSGNRIFGISVYAQQAVSVFSALVIIVAIVYVRKVFVNKNEKAN